MDAAPPPEDSSVDIYANRIFVTKLGHSMTEEDVRVYFETFGELIDFYMPFTSEGKHKGIAFISFSEPDMKAAVLQEETHVINDVETARKRLDKVSNRIRYADRGYAGFFDAIKVKEDALERVYQFDLRLLGGVDQIRAAAEHAATAPDVTQAVRDMITAIDAVDASLADREAILTGIR